MRDPRLAGSDCLLQKLCRGFLFLGESGIDTINKDVRVNELRHAGRDRLDAIHALQLWLDAGNRCSVIVVFFAFP
jgi:hypothetical protein